MISRRLLSSTYRHLGAGPLFIEGQLSQKDLQQLALDLLIDPVSQIAPWTELPFVRSPTGTAFSNE